MGPALLAQSYLALKNKEVFKNPNGTNKGGLRNTSQIIIIIIKIIIKKKSKPTKKHFQRSIPEKNTLESHIQEGA